MAKESFYDGGYSSFNASNTNFTGFRMNMSKLGFPGSPFKADQLTELANAAKTGVKTFEVTFLGLQGETDQVIPTQVLKEIRALTKLTGIKPTFHGPLIDPAGFGGNGWSGEDGRKENERKMLDALSKAHMIKPEGNIPVVFHSANGMPGITYRPGDKKKDEPTFVEKRVPVINSDNGRIVAFMEEEKDYGLGNLTSEGPKVMTPRERIERLNEQEWNENKKNLAILDGKVLEAIGDSGIVKTRYNEILQAKTEAEKEKALKEFGQALKENPVDSFSMQRANFLLGESRKQFNGLFETAYKYGSSEQKEELVKLSENWKKDLEKSEESLSKSKDTVGYLASQYGLQHSYLKSFYDIVGKGEAPKIYQDVETFGIEKASDTFGNAAAEAYKKFGNTMPILAVENVWQDMGFSRAKDMKKLIDKSREKFARKLVSEKGLKEKEAQKAAEKFIGVNWDMGHLNIMKKHGFQDKKYMIDETKAIAPYVKHLHITDNWGFSDSHLAPGMGNVPIKEIMMELEKAGRINEIHKIVESGGMMQHFGKSPHHLMSLAAFDSGIYNVKAGPYWNQISSINGPYFGGYGTVNPDVHHSMYGSSFTSLPQELGGQVSNGRSRFGGTPMS